MCTDSSKLNGAVGSGIFSGSIGIARYIRSPDHCSVLQAEEVVIQAAARIIGTENSPSGMSPYILKARRLSRL